MSLQKVNNETLTFFFVAKLAKLFIYQTNLLVVSIQVNHFTYTKSKGRSMPRMRVKVFTMYKLIKFKK
jgi:hypothetical protein